MATNIIKNQVNGAVVIHVTSSSNVIITGNSSVSNVAIGDEYVIGSQIKQVWVGSSSGNAAYWVVTKHVNATVNAVVGVYDSTAWIDYAGNGTTLNLLEDAANVQFTLVNAAADEGYIMVELKKVIGPTPP